MMPRCVIRHLDRFLDSNRFLKIIFLNYVKKNIDGAYTSSISALCGCLSQSKPVVIISNVRLRHCHQYIYVLLQSFGQFSFIQCTMPHYSAYDNRDTPVKKSKFWFLLPQIVCQWIHNSEQAKNRTYGFD